MSLSRIPVRKGRPALYIVLLIGVVVLMALLYKCSRPSSDGRQLAPTVAKSGGDTLDIAIEFSPLSYRMSGDTITGLDYELLNLLSRVSGHPVKFHPIAGLNNAMSEMENGLYDIVVSSLPVTETLKQQFTLSDNVYLDREVLVQRRDARPYYDRPEMLGGDTVWIADGSPFTERISNLSDEIGDTITIISPSGRTAEHLVMLVARGEIPRAVVNEGIARRMKTEMYPDLDITTPISFTQFQCWIVATSVPAVADSLNVWMGRMRQDSQYDAILERYGVEKP